MTHTQEILDCSQCALDHDEAALRFCSRHDTPALADALDAMEAKWATAVAFGSVIETERDKWKADYEHDMAVMDMRLGRARDELAQTRAQLADEQSEVALKQRCISGMSRDLDDQITSYQRAMKAEHGKREALEIELAERQATLSRERHERRLDLGTIARHEHMLNLQEKDIKRMSTQIDNLRALLAEVCTLTLDAVDSTSDVGNRVREIRREVGL